MAQQLRAHAVLAEDMRIPTSMPPALTHVCNSKKVLKKKSVLSKSAEWARPSVLKPVTELNEDN